MNQEEKKLITGVKHKLLSWFLGLALTAIVTAVGFYFNTSHVMAQNSADIKLQKEDIKKIRNDISTIKTVPVINQFEIKSIKDDVKRIENSVDEIENKTNRIMELLLQIKNNQRVSN